MAFHNTQGDALGYVLDGLSGYSTHVFHELPKLEYLNPYPWQKLNSSLTTLVYVE